jgi:outer membrane protein
MIQSIAPFVLAALEMQVLTLREAERQAEAHHPALAIGEQAAAAADARSLESRAALLPQVLATLSYRYATANRTVRIGTPAIAIPSLTSGSRAPSTSLYDYLNTGVVASQLLYDFGQSSQVWRASRHLAEGATLDARGIRLAVILDVRTAYFVARARRELVEVAREDLGNQRKHLQQVAGLVDVKVRPPIDLVQAKANVGGAELRLITAENDYAIARAELVRAMGDSHADDGYDVGSDELPPVPGEEAGLDELVAHASQRRPDLASSERQIQAQEHLLAAARGGYGPSLHLTLSATDSGPMFDNGPFEWRGLRWNYGAALALAWPILEGGRTIGRVREADANLGQAKARRSVLDLNLRVEVERARRSIAAAKAAITVAESTAENARERLRLAEGRYAAGAGTALEVSDAQLAHVTAAAQRVASRYELATARAQLLHALGRAD